MANAAYESVATNVGFSVSSLAVSAPTGTASGKGLVAIVVTASSGTPPTIPTPPSGWTQRQTFTQTMFGLNLRFYVFSKFAGGSEPGSYTFTGSGTSDVMTGDIILIDNVLDSTFFQSIATQNYNSNNTPQANSVTTDKTNQTIFWIVYHGFGSGITGTVPSGFSEVYDADPLVIGTRVQASAGATGTATGGLSVSDEWIAWQIGVYGEDSTGGGSGWGPLLGQHRNRLVA